MGNRLLYTESFYNSIEFLPIQIYLIFLFLLSYLMSKATIYLGASLPNYINQKTSFECGFDRLRTARQPFSLIFYHLALFYLVVDVETVLISPLIVTLGLRLNTNGISTAILWILFVVILAVGLTHERREGALRIKIRKTPR